MTDDELPDRLREALHSKASSIEPSAGAWSRRHPGTRSRPWLVPGLVAAVVVALAVTVPIGISHRSAPPGSATPEASSSATPTPTSPANVAAVTTRGPLSPGETSPSTAAPTTSGPTLEPTTALTTSVVPPVETTSTEPTVATTDTTVPPSSTSPAEPTPTFSLLPTTLVTSGVRVSCGPLPGREAQPNAMCPMNPERTMPADGTTTAAALGWGVSDIGQNGATITMEGSADGSVTMTNGADTRTFDSSSGPVHVFSTPVLNGRGVWGVVPTTVTKIVITSTADAAEAIPVLHPLGRWQGFVSAETSDVEFPATVAGFDADGRQVFSVVIQA